MNMLSSIIPILSNNKALECDKLVITIIEVGNRAFLIACEGRIISIK